MSTDPFVVVHGKRFKRLLSAEEIQGIVRQLAHQIVQRHRSEELVCVVILKGAFMFANDLIRAMNIPCEITFLRAQSYGAHMYSSGKVHIEFFTNHQRLQDRPVLIIEDIVDSGLTLQAIRDYLAQYRPKSIETVTLLLKPDTFQGTPPEYVGKAIAPLFVIVYGMDYNDGGRYLQDIYVLDSETAGTESTSNNG